MANITRKEPGQGMVTRGGEWDPFRMMRDLLRWDPFGEMAPYSGGLAERTGSFIPAFEVKESKQGYLFRADLPGVKDADLEIAINGNRLTVSGKREAEDHQESDTYYAFERSYGSFSRSFTLPEGIDDEHVHAELKNGVLTLLVPKRPEAQPKKIQIKSSDGKAQA